MDVTMFNYRRIFGMTQQQVEEEPLDRFFTNLYIYAEIMEKQRLEQKFNG